MDNTTWKAIGDIDIVYHTASYNNVELDSVTYPKAYVVTHGDEKMMQSALSWATTRGNTPKIVTTTNEGFGVRIAQAADSSFQSGKLAFWMCVFEKDGIEPFATGINSDLLCLFITQSTLVNGRLENDKAFFARHNGQLGILHKQMPAYQDYQAARARRDLMSSNKTTKWVPGNIYATLKRSDVMIGDMVMPLIVKASRQRRRNTYAYAPAVKETYQLDFDAKPVKMYGHAPSDGHIYSCGVTVEIGEGPDKFDDFEATLEKAMLGNILKPHTTCPSRRCEGPAPFADKICRQGTAEALAKICSIHLARLAGTDSSTNSWVRLVQYDLTLCELSPELGVKALKDLDAAMPKRERSYEKRSDDLFELEQGSTTTTFTDRLDMMRHIIKIARQHYAITP